MSIRGLSIGFEPDELMEREVYLHYRIVVDWSHETGFCARCVELPQVYAQGATADGTVHLLQIRLRHFIAQAHGQPISPPAKEQEGPLGGWRLAWEPVAAPEELAAPRPMLDESEILELRRIARCTAARYRVILETNDSGLAAWSPEFPEELAQGATVTEAIEALRRQLAQCALRMLAYGRMPPEPMQDVERRQASARAKAA